ncbi:hypothetical protein ACSBR1_019258 [Camellia fascicularis]
MDPRKSRKSDDDIVAIIQRYNKKTKAFTVGKKNLTFTTNDMTLIFGLQGGKGGMSLRYSKKPKSVFLRRRFPKDTRLTGPILKNALVKTMKGKQPIDYKDVAIIATLLPATTVAHEHLPPDRRRYDHLLTGDGTTTSSPATVQPISPRAAFFLSISRSQQPLEHTLQI